MTTVGLIGSGHIGSTVARLAVDAGHDVVLSNSRGPETLADLGSLQRPAGHQERSALPIAGDDEGAKQTVAEFLDSIGYDAYDAGPLAEGWRYQPDTPAYGLVYVAPGTDFPGPGRQVTADM